MILRGLFFCIALVAAMPAFAASRDIISTQNSEKRIALIIGNGAYKNVSPLTNPPNDARLMAQTLSAVGFNLVGGKALIDADKATIERAIRDFGRALTSGAVGLFYYAGHGVQVNGANYLIPVAANVTGEADIKYELVDASFVLDEMSNAGNRLNIVILDACRNNPFGGRGLRAVSSGLATINAPAGTVISYATQPGNVASDGVGGNSPYTTALAAAVKMQGADLFETFNTVGLKVKQTSGGKQQPWLATSPVEGKFYFAGLPASAAVTPQPQNAGPAFDPRALELSFWDSIKNSSEPSDFAAYLEQFPTGQFAALARTRATPKVAPSVLQPSQQATLTPPIDTVVRPVPQSPSTELQSAFMVLLNSAKTEAELMRTWERLASSNRDTFAGFSPTVVRADLGANGVFYRLRTGPLADKAAADALCTTLMAKNIGCVVVRP